jgi:hypothetical protein
MDSQIEFPPMSRSPYIGIWRLVSFDYEDQISGEHSPRFGTMPKGRLLLLGNGLMMAILTAEDRPIPTTNEDRAMAFNTVIAYSGKYTVQDGKLNINVDISWNEAWTSTLQIRSYHFVNSRLQLTSAWAPSPFEPNRIVRGIMEWERET